ncbi:OmpA family protein [Polymorphobacter arshaanensis]|uniref:OmpA family protein n=1 Tax=Glacieibacterium arshaanense TaxID=2511025 RepID=A0A4Y9EQ99_9SPHN|nr:OmpA family protein [Polymorphobacter arshaanensis]TFU05787.1 OmpA family protein [Polymorphobacter arshaanensis]
MRPALTHTAAIVPLVAFALLGGCVSQTRYNSQVAATAAAQNLSAQNAELNKQLAAEIADKQVTIQQLNDRLVVTLVDQVLFASGSAELHPKGRAVLDKAIPTLAAQTGKWIIIEGHTDDQPIGPSIIARFPTNWDLSTARATSVVKYLQDKGVPPVNLAATGYSQYQPVKPNTTAAGRQANRRIEIILRMK